MSCPALISVRYRKVGCLETKQFPICNEVGPLACLEIESPDITNGLSRLYDLEMRYPIAS